MSVKKILMKYVYSATIFLAALAFIYASYNFTKAYLGYLTSDESYDEINDMFNTQETLVEDDDENTQNDSGEVTETVSFTNEVTKWVWDFDSMKEYNSDSLGYIKQENSRIQYPILQYKDNDYYLTHGADRLSNGNGAIFVDYRCTEGLESDNCIIYGHNMKSGSMFASLLKYSNEDYYRENPTFDIYIGYKHYIYYVFAAKTVPETNGYVYEVDFEDDEAYLEWLEKCINSSLYKTDIQELDIDDKIITLSTCTNSDSSKRFVVQLVRGEEIID